MAAVESHGASPPVPSFECGAHSQVVAQSSHSDTNKDCGGPGKANLKCHPQERMWEGNTKGSLNPALTIGTTVTGSIQAKTDSAYLFTAVIQGEEVKGVLYHVLPKSTVKQCTKVMAPPVQLQAGDMDSKTNGSVRRRYRRRKFLTKDRNAPKKNRTGYNFFFADERIRLKETFPEMRREKAISQAIGDAWSKLPQEEKKLYQERGVKDKERYRKEMRQYVYERLRKLKPLDKVTNADGGVLLQEDESSPLALDTLPRKEPQADGGVPIEEDGSNLLQLKKLSRAPGAI